MKFSYQEFILKVLVKEENIIIFRKKFFVSESNSLIENQEFFWLDNNYRGKKYEQLYDWVKSQEEVLEGN